MQNITQTVAAQQAYFATGATLPVAFRQKQLRKLRLSLLAHEQAIYKAFKLDLNKSQFETYESEIGLVLQEISDMCSHLPRWAKAQRAKTSLVNMPGTSKIYPEPYGVALIIAPWNYPLQLTLSPLIGAIGAGNCAVVKPSNYTPHVAEVIRVIIQQCFSPKYVAVVMGGRQANQHLLEQKFDYIFFTGGVAVGKVVMRAAAEHLTPVTLELGGKSPCIVDETANLAMAAKRIAWGKCLNAGQTCVAPDYLYVHESVKDKLLALIAQAFTSFYGEKPEQNKQYPRIVNQKHFERINHLIAASGTVYAGGRSNPSTLQIAPTLLDTITWQAPVMGEEIFGPVLPVLTFRSIEDVIAAVRAQPKPLALYLFTKNKAVERQVLSHLPFGGGCINETIMHMVTPHMPFGGVGNSGMGAYHGKYSFDTFSHHKSVLNKGTWFDLPTRYAPYTDTSFSLLKKVMK